MRSHAFEHWSLVYAHVDHHQMMEVRRPLILGVCQSAAEHLFQHARTAMGLIAQHVQGLVGQFAADQVGQGTHLACADACETMNSLVCHYTTGAFLPVPLPPWPRKVRVGANSPRRWPTISSVM